jgi:hypothetical protein
VKRSDLVKQTRKAIIGINLVDIFKDTTESNTASLLEIDRFKAKIIEIWSRMLRETYSQYYNEESDDSPSIDEFLEENALKFSDEPEPESELDSIMEMLDTLMESSEELEEVESEGKAPTYKGSELKSNKEKGKTEATVYEFKSKTTKTPSDSRSGVKGGSYEGTPSGKVSKKKDDPVITKYSPILEQIRDEVKSLADRRRIGRRKQLFRL